MIDDARQHAKPIEHAQRRAHQRGGAPVVLSRCGTEQTHGKSGLRQAERRDHPGRPRAGDRYLEFLRCHSLRSTLVRSKSTS